MKPAESYILNQPEPYRAILLHIQMLIESSFPSVALKYKWKLPVYYLNDRPLCYLNVSQKKGFVDVGFWASAQLSYNEHLVTEGRKVVKSLRYFSLEALEKKILFTVLEEAYTSIEKGFYKK
uniref:DUF1801 domain-containing protein n=1 Tax=Polaribacter sp. TaxID=1920175 RepID=UPI004047F125